MSKLWAIARQTIAEAIRTKTALAFIILVALVVFGLPFTVRGDETVTGAVQTYLTYGLGATTILLYGLTVFMARTVSDELVKRQIFLLMTKPVARWQYILGKWGGVVGLNFALLVLSSLAVYCFTVYMIARRPSKVPGDHERLWSEVLTARHASPMQVPTQELVQQARQFFEERKAAGDYENAVKDYDDAKRKQFEEDELKKVYTALEQRWRTVPPFEERQLDFKNVLCDRTRRLRAELQGSGGARGEARYEQSASGGQLSRWLEVEITGGPAGEPLSVLIDEARAGMLTPDAGGTGKLVVTDAAGQPWPEGLPDLMVGQSVRVATVAKGVFKSTNLVQLRYKAMAASSIKDEVLRSAWRFGEASKGATTYWAGRSDVVDKYHYIPIPADAVADDHTLLAIFHNPVLPDVQPAIAFLAPEAQVEVLFTVGSFEGNLLRWFAMTMCTLMFLAAVALLAASLFSFPVAFLVTLTVLILSCSRGFILESFEFLNVGDLPTAVKWLVQGALYVLQALMYIAPDFSRFDGSELLRDGRNVTLTWVFSAIGTLVIIWTTVAILLGCLAFSRRQVAEVSV